MFISIGQVYSRLNRKSRYFPKKNLSDFIVFFSCITYSFMYNKGMDKGAFMGDSNQLKSGMGKRSDPSGSKVPSFSLAHALFFF